MCTKLDTHAILDIYTHTNAHAHTSAHLAHTHLQRQDKTRARRDDKATLTRNKKKTQTHPKLVSLSLSSMSTNSVRCYEIPPAPGKMSHFLLFFMQPEGSVCPSPSVAGVKGRFPRCFLVVFYAWIFDAQNTNCTVLATRWSNCNIYLWYYFKW